MLMRLLYKYSYLEYKLHRIKFCRVIHLNHEYNAHKLLPMCRENIEVLNKIAS